MQGHHSEKSILNAGRAERPRTMATRRRPWTRGFPRAAAGLLAFGLLVPASGAAGEPPFSLFAGPGGDSTGEFRLGARPWLAPLPTGGIVVPAPWASVAREADRSPAPAADRPHRFFLAAGEVALGILVPWVYDRYVTNEDFAHISWHTVSGNFKAGFGFDRDDFDTNQSYHPYQGSLFFEAGRSNGYGYWESGLFALAGSFIWECCMENDRPSINDLVNTTLGGMTRGEVQHRLSIMVLDTTSTGSERFFREIGAAILNPIGAITRLAEGDVGRVYPNPDERYPSGFAVSVDAGYRHVEEAEHENQALLTVDARYGDPFAGDLRQPFDSFWAAMDMDFPNPQPITRFEERGVLRGWDLSDTAAPARYLFELTQDYEYFNNAAEVFGAQMFSAGVLSRYPLGNGVSAAAELAASAIPLAGVKTIDFENPATGRNYDYGPGGGVRAGVRIYLGARELLDVGYGVAWIATVNGFSDDNTLQFFRAEASVPIAGLLGAGGGYRWYSRKTSYSNGFFEPRQTQAEWRVFLRFAFGAEGLRAPRD